MKFIKEYLFILLLVLLIIYYIFKKKYISNFRHLNIFNNIKNLINSKNNKRKVHFGRVEFKIVDKNLPVKDIFR